MGWDKPQQTGREHLGSAFQPRQMLRGSSEIRGVLHSLIHVLCTDQDEEQQKELMSSEMGSVALLHAQFTFTCRNDFPHPGTRIFIENPAQVLQDQQLFAAA